MNKPDAPFGSLRQHVVRKAIEIIRDRVHRVDHDSLGCSGMRALALKRHSGCARAPRLSADLTQLFTVNGVSELCAEGLHVKLLDAPAHFFVRRESNRD